MNDKDLEKLYRDAGWTEEQIEAAKIINEQMGKFLDAINKDQNDIDLLKE